MKKICLVLILLLFIFPAYAAGVHIIKKGNITSVQNENDPLYRIEQKMHKSTPKERMKALEDMLIHPENYLPVEYAAVADDVYNKGDKDGGALLFLIARYRMSQDINMCEDVTAGGAIYALSILAPKSMSYASNVEEKKYVSLLRKMLEWDEKFPARPSPKWVCYHGIRAFYNDVRLVPESEFDKIKQEVRDACLKTIKHYESKEN